MGIHLHKAIGWAVPCAEDPFDRESRQAVRTFADHAVWLRCKATAVTDEEIRGDILYEAGILEGAPRNMLLSQCAIHIPQLDAGTLLLIPPAHLKDWSRMDDDLDCAFAEDTPVMDRITYTRSSPFAFSHLWMDSITRRPLAGPAGDAVALEGTPRGDQAAARVRFQGETTPAYRDPGEAAQRIAPGIPREVVQLVQHLGGFLTPDRLLQLRPARAAWMG